MLEVVRRRLVEAAPQEIWPDIADGQRFAEWFAFCDTVEEPSPGRRVLIGSWGSSRSTVVTEITEEVAPRRWAWRHVEERLDDRPAPQMSIDTRVRIDLEPVGEATEVTITSRQEPAGWVQSLVLRVAGKRQIAGMLEQSLTLLAARHA